MVSVILWEQHPCVLCVRGQPEQVLLAQASYMQWPRCAWSHPCCLLPPGCTCGLPGLPHAQLMEEKPQRAGCTSKHIRVDRQLQPCARVWDVPVSGDEKPARGSGLWHYLFVFLAQKKQSRVFACGFVADSMVGWSGTWWKRDWEIISDKEMWETTCGLISMNAKIK